MPRRGKTKKKTAGNFMCTSIALVGENFCFGRTLDLDRDFGDGVVITPRNYVLSLRCGDVITRHHGFMGKATVVNGFPLYADGMNEHGVCIAALDFKGNAYYPKAPASGKRGIAPFEVIPYVLALSKSLADARRVLESISIVDLPFSDVIPSSALHWHIADKSGSLVIESVADGLRIYENEYNVLANNPPFPFHRDNYTLYLNATNEPASDGRVFCNGVMGHGIPGDYTSPSRFVRAAWLVRYARCNEGEETAALYSILGAVAPPRGCVIREDGGEHFTQHTCVMCPKDLSYTYKRGNCTEILHTYIKKESLDGETLI